MILVNRDCNRDPNIYCPQKEGVYYDGSTLNPKFYTRPQTPSEFAEQRFLDGRSPNSLQQVTGFRVLWLTGFIGFMGLIGFMRVIGFLGLKVWGLSSLSVL